MSTALYRDRFAADWKSVSGAGFADKALIALSGGPDSTALLLLFNMIKDNVNPPSAATVDHRLRPNSSSEAGAAADLCRLIDTPHTILVGDLPARAGLTANISARARALRYDLLRQHAREIGATWIVTAHSADDQLETVVMRLNRGSGVRGLSAIRRVDGDVLRPLLNWRRFELAAIVAAAGVTAVNDPSNVDDRFDRARLRKQLAAIDWLDPIKAARSAAALGDADQALEFATDMLEQDLVQFGVNQAILKLSWHPAELRRRLVERCLRHVQPSIELRGKDLEPFRASWMDIAPRTVGNVLVELVASRVEGFPIPTLVFRPAPRRRR